MHFFIKLAEQIIEVKSMYDKVCSMCQRYIISDSTHIEPDIVIETSRSDLEKFRENTNIENDARQNDISHNEYLETLSVYTKIANAMIEYDTLLIHGSPNPQSPIPNPQSPIPHKIIFIFYIFYIKN